MDASERATTAGWDDHADILELLAAKSKASGVHPFCDEIPDALLALFLLLLLRAIWRFYT